MKKEIVEAFKKMDTASVSDAMDKLGIPCGLKGIKPVVRGRHICGEAFTVHYVPCGTVKGTVGDFLDDVQEGQVIVIDNSGRDYCTVWGDIMTFTATQKKIAGTVIDGVCRDVDGIEKLNYAVYTKGTYMVTGKERVQVDAVNIPVAMSGVQVRPGDLVLGDDSGVVVVPADLAEKVLETAQNIEATEQKIIAEVKAGSTLKEARAKLGYHHLQSKE